MSDDLLSAADIAVIYKRKRRTVAELYANDPSWPKAVWIGRRRYYDATEVAKWFRRKSGPQFRLSSGCSTPEAATGSGAR